MLSVPVKDDKYLPGASKAMIRRVRRHLKRFGLVPMDPCWRQAWRWAETVARRNILFVFGKQFKTFERRRLHWPSSEEIATQYVVLLLATMQGERALKLPYRANLMPDDVRATLAGAAKGRRLAIVEDPNGLLARIPSLQHEAGEAVGLIPAAATRQATDPS